MESSFLKLIASELITNSSLSLSEISEYSSIKYSTLVAIKSNLYNNLRTSTILKLSAFFNVSIAQLLKIEKLDLSSVKFNKSIASIQNINFKKNISINLSYLLDTNNIFLNQLSKDIGAPYSSLNDILMQKYEDPKIYLVYLTANYFKVNIDSFIRTEINKQPKINNNNFLKYIPVLNFCDIESLNLAHKQGSVIKSIFTIAIYKTSIANAGIIPPDFCIDLWSQNIVLLINYSRKYAEPSEFILGLINNKYTILQKYSEDEFFCFKTSNKYSIKEIDEFYNVLSFLSI